MRRGVNNRAWRVSALIVCAVSSVVTFASLAAPPPAATIPVERIDLNSAPPARLQLLQGVGPTLAERIVTDREENGLFATLEDVDRVPRIGERTLRAIEADVTLGRVAP